MSNSNTLFLGAILFSAPHISEALAVVLGIACLAVGVVCFVVEVWRGK